MTAYYNENDPYASQWLRNLIAGGKIATGEVDERSIVDVHPSDLKGYSQCHFFAGIGGWSYALRMAGWKDEKEVWTGSCPCQPFSAAGKQKGVKDERHLWPAWFSLIAKCKPATIFGEQVAAAIGKGWLDAVFADLEGEGYACGAAVLPACGVGAPHIRQRLWFVADADGAGRGLKRGGRIFDGKRTAHRYDADGCGELRGMDDTICNGWGAVGNDHQSDVGIFLDADGGVELDDTNKSGSQGRSLDLGEHADQRIAWKASQSRELGGRRG